MLLMNFEERKQRIKWHYDGATLLQDINCTANEQMKQDAIDFKPFSYLGTLVSFWCLYTGDKESPQDKSGSSSMFIMTFKSQVILSFPWIRNGEASFFCFSWIVCKE